MARKKYEIPSTGTLPKKGVKQFSAVYVSARERGFTQQRSAQQAWCEIKRYYYKRGDKWIKRKDPIPQDESPPGCAPGPRAANIGAVGTSIRRLKNSLLS